MNKNTKIIRIYSKKLKRKQRKYTAPTNNLNLLEDIQTIAPEENCPPVSVWVRVRVSFRVGGNFSRGQLS